MNLSEQLTLKLIELQVIDSNDKAIYLYGFQQGTLLLINILTLMIIGVFFNMTWQTMFFLSSYSVPRVYAGGYHAKTKLRCYLFSIGMITSSLYLIKYIPWGWYRYIITLIVSSSIILMLAPVEDKNKPLDKLERSVYRQKSITILSFLVGLSTLLWFAKARQASISICVALGGLAVVLVLGKLNKLGRDRIKLVLHKMEEE